MSAGAPPSGEEAEAAPPPRLLDSAKTRNSLSCTDLFAATDRADVLGDDQ